MIIANCTFGFSNKISYSILLLGCNPKGGSNILGNSWKIDYQYGKPVVGVDTESKLDYTCQIILHKWVLAYA